MLLLHLEVGARVYFDEIGAEEVGTKRYAHTLSMFHEVFSSFTIAPILEIILLDLVFSVGKYH